MYMYTYTFTVSIAACTESKDSCVTDEQRIDGDILSNFRMV